MSKRFLTLGLAGLLAAGVCFAPADGAGGGEAYDPAVRTTKIKDALSRLDPSEDADWTEGGLPSMTRMKELTGLEDLKRNEVGEALPGFARTNAGAAPSDLSNAGNIPEGGPYAGDTHTADQQEQLEAAKATVDGTEEGLPDPSKIAAHIPDPILLIEAANIAMNADDRFRKNGELQAFMRHYLVSQVNIKAHQERLNKRYTDAQKAAAAAG